tara:strand:+ start:58264 stop:59184 length:921 start_codon:yes stop_codon:yes gene_type:complete
MPPLIGLIQLLAIGFGLYLLTLILYTMRGLTRPHRQTYASAVARSLPGDPSELDTPLEYESCTIKGTQGDIELWMLKGNHPDGPTLVMTHGWGSSRQGGLKRLEPFIERCSRIVIWDIPGHGDSGGHTRLGSQEHNDLARVLDSIPGSESIVLFGWSMGAGVSLACADQYTGEHKAGDHTIIAIICESPYSIAITPARNVIRLRGVPHRLNLKPAIALLGIRFGIGPSWRGFDRTQIASRIKQPILILHGTEDPVSPIADGRAITQSAPNARLVEIEDAGHNNLWMDEEFRAQTIDAVEGFMDSLS